MYRSRYLQKASRSKEKFEGQKKGYTEHVRKQCTYDEQHADLRRDLGHGQLRADEKSKMVPFLFLRLNSWTKWLTRRLSKISPPKWVSPAVALTSKMPSSIARSDTHTRGQLIRVHPD